MNADLCRPTFVLLLVIGGPFLTAADEQSVEWRAAGREPRAW
jgi:hypothetical protein